MRVKERHLAFLQCVSLGRLVGPTACVSSISVIGSVTVRRGASYGRMSKSQKLTKHELADRCSFKPILEGGFNIK